MTDTIGPVCVLGKSPLVVRLWTTMENGEPHERMLVYEGDFDCPRCGLTWPLERETEEWSIAADGIWNHKLFGMPHGDCPECRLAVFGGFDEDYVIDYGH